MKGLQDTGQVGFEKAQVYHLMVSIKVCEAP